MILIGRSLDRLKGIHMNLNGMSLYEFKRDPRESKRDPG